MLQGCLYTAHHFNTGKLLPSGDTHWEFGVGNQKTMHSGCSYEVSQTKLQELQIQANSLPHLQRENNFGYNYPYEATNDQGENVCEVNAYVGLDSVQNLPVYLSAQFPVQRFESSVTSLSLGWRLGVRDDWGPFTGVDLGWKLEGFFPLATLELDTRIGLPRPSALAPFHHDLALGWGIGAWADNSLFGEYALGWGTGRLRPFANTRITYLATQPHDLLAQSEFLSFESYRRWVGQALLGCEVVLPQYFLLPGRILPTVSVAWPSLPFAPDAGHPQGQGLDWRFALGIGSSW